MFTFLVNTFFGAIYTDALNGFRIINFRRQGLG